MLLGRIGRRSVRLLSTAAAPPCKSTSTPLLNIVLHEPQIPPNTGTAARSKLARSSLRGHPPLQKPTRLLRAALAVVAVECFAHYTAFGRPGTIGRLALATRCRLHLVGRLGFSLDEKGFRRDARPRRPALCVHCTCTACALHVDPGARASTTGRWSTVCTTRRGRITWRRQRSRVKLASYWPAAAAELDAWGSGSPRGAGDPSGSSAELGPLGPALQPWSVSEAPTKDADPAAFLASRRRRSGRSSSRPMPHARTGAHRSVAVTICSSATKEQGHPSTCTSGSCSSLLRVAFWRRHSSPHWPPRTDPLGVGLLYALKRRALSLGSP